jgi:cytosine/adenosine deaminase-related metal-dependent hydrolase
MDYLWKVSMGIHKTRVNPREILKMATVNGGKILKKEIGIIGTGKFADGIFIEKHSLDLEPMHNVHASIVHRASESNIRAVMIGGKIVHGKI